MMMSFNDFIQKYNLKEATSKTKIQQILPFLGLNDLGSYIRNGPFSIVTGIVNLHP